MSPAGASQVDLAAIAQPYLDRLSSEIGEGVQADGDRQERRSVLAAAHGRREYALTVAPGQRLAAHAGAAGKLLLAYLPEAELARSGWHAAGRPSPPRPSPTPSGCKTELPRIRRLGWSQDKGETACQRSSPSRRRSSIRRSEMVAALSVPSSPAPKPSRMEDIRLATIAAAKALTAAIPGPVTPLASSISTSAWQGVPGLHQQARLWPREFGAGFRRATADRPATASDRACRAATRPQSSTAFACAAARIEAVGLRHVVDGERVAPLARAA